MDALISQNTRIRYPELFSIGRYSIVDDYSYFSTQVRIGHGTHIASGCTVGGGKERLFQIGDYCSLSSGVKIYCSSNDYVNDLIVINPDKNLDIGDKQISGDVLIGNYCGVGANAVIMPGNKIPEGVAIGALSFVPAFFAFAPWSVYAGTPIRRIKARNKERILNQIGILDSFLGKKE